MASIFPKEKIQISGTTYRFQGSEYGDIPVSFFWVFTLPGQGSKLHFHPYKEVFVLQQGHVTFTVGDETIEAQSGEIVVAPANTPHKFTNSGEEPLQMISFHPSKQVIRLILRNKFRTGIQRYALSVGFWSVCTQEPNRKDLKERHPVSYSELVYPIHKEKELADGPGYLSNHTVRDSR